MNKPLNPAERIAAAPTLVVGENWRVTLNRTAVRRWQQNRATYFRTTCTEPVATWHVPPASTLPRSIFRTWT